MSLSTSRNNEIEEIYYQEKQVDLPLLNNNDRFEQTASDGGLTLYDHPVTGL